MNESLLHYIWQQRLFPTTQLHTTDDEELEIISVGTYNTDAGADFFNAKVKIGNIMWAGDIEIHLQSSDWIAHHHDKNAAYNNVVLHVVGKCNAEIKDASGRKIPQFILSIDKKIEQNYETLLHSPYSIPCEKKITEVAPFTRSSTIDSLVMERMMTKSSTITDLLQCNGGDWSSAFYHIIARSFGFGKNGDAMQSLARSLPLSYIAKHRDNLLQIEALLFGQASLLPSQPTDEYSQQLCNEYNFLRSKFNLTPINPSIWKMARLRPQNFPQVRLAQFASLLHTSSHLFSKILEEPNLEHLRLLFQVEISDYWLTHYTFRNTSHLSHKRLSAHSIDSIIINTIVPFLFAYGNSRDNQSYCDRALSFLEEIDAESNAIVTHYESLGFQVKNAFDSQGILQLHTYCNRKDCIRCRIGNELLRK